MMVRHHSRKPDNSKATAKLPVTLGPFSGMAQDGPARKTRPTVMAEEILSRGCAFVEKGIWDEAEREFRKAIKMAPEYPEAYNNLGLCMLIDGRPEEARETLHEAVRQFPGWSHAEANLALACQQLEEHAGAVKYFRQSLAHKSAQPQVSLSLGDSLNALGHSNDALAAFEKARELFPQYALAYSRIGILHARKGKFEEAETSLTYAVQLDPTNSEALAVLGVISARRGNFDQAKDWFSKIAADPVPASAQRGTQRIEQFETGARQGFEEFKATQAPAKPLAECYYELGLAHLEAGDLADAQSMFQGAVRHNPEWIAPQLFLAFGEALQGNGLDAKSAFEVAARIDPQNGAISEQLGYLALGMGLTKEADLHFKKATELGRSLPPELVKMDA